MQCDPPRPRPGSAPYNMGATTPVTGIGSFGSRTVKHDTAQLHGPGGNTTGQGHVVPPNVTASASAAMMMIVSTTNSGQTKRSQRS